VARRGCTRCHDGGRAPELRWGQKTARQWKYFIRRKRHARHAELERRFSKGELKRLLAYILKRLEDEQKSGIAGVK
jgi:hypothetical protein